MALADFLDGFYALRSDGARADALAAEPPLVGDPIRNAYVGAVAEHLARQYAFAAPEWTNDGCRFLRRPYFAGGLESLKAMLLVESPLAFRRRMIFVDHNPLRRA